VFTLKSFSTEIRTFYSLKEIRETVEEEINQCSMLLEDYSEWLGMLLRNPESSKNQEWAKKATQLQKLLRSGGSRRRGKKEEKSEAVAEWIQFKNIMLCADNFGEAEILFEVVEELRSKVEKLQKVKGSIGDLERYGLGKDVLYIAYIHEGALEKIVFKPKKETDSKEKFKFIADFSVVG